MTRTLDDWRSRAGALEVDPLPFIAGERASAHGASFVSVNPATQKTVATYTICDEACVEEAVSAASNAFDDGAWREAPYAERAGVMTAFANLIRQEHETLALMDTLEMGMPITQSLGDVQYSADAIDETASIAQGLIAPAGVTSRGALTMNTFEPRGVVAAITPWNFPVNQALVRIIPALMMGNSVILKPSEVAPASALLMADLLRAAGLPKGVFSVLTGDGSTGDALVRNPEIAMVAFTGSTATGARIQAATSSNGAPKPLVMELGGKSPHIVGATFEDLDGLAPIIAEGVFRNTGQVCSAGTRLLTHEGSGNDLLTAIIDRAGADYQPGDPLDPSTAVGPLANLAQAGRVAEKMANAEASGLKPLCGGRAAVDGVWAQPTVYDETDSASAIAREEVFGPVLAASRFTTAEEAAKLANASGFGLVASVWTRDFWEAGFLSRRIRAGSVTVSDSVDGSGEFARILGLEPAGLSGFGADYGASGLRAYAQEKLLLLNTGYGACKR